MVKSCINLSPRFLFIMFSSINFLIFLDRGALSSVIIQLKSSKNGGLGLSSLEAGSLGSVFILGYMISSPIFAHLSQAFHPLYLILIGNTIWSISVMLTGLARTYFLLLIARAFTGIGEASFVCLAPPLILDSALPENKNKWIGIFYASSALGYAFGFVYGVQISEMFGGWYYPFLFEPVLMAPFIFFCIVCHKDDKLHIRSEESEHIHQQIWTLLKIPIFVLLCLGYSSFNFTIGGLAFWGPDFIETYYGLSSSNSAYALGSITIFTAITATATGSSLLDKFFAPYEYSFSLNEISESKLTFLKIEKACVILPIGLFSGMSISLLFLFISTLFPAPYNFIIFLSGLAISEFCIFITSSPIGISTMLCVPLHLRGQANAISNFIMHALGDFPSPTLIGVWFDMVGMFWGMVFTCSWLLIGTVLWLLAWNISRFHSMPLKYVFEHFFRRAGDLPDGQLNDSLTIN